MAFTIAVLADLHLPEMADTAQEACLDWALRELCRLRPDVIVVAGDITASGSAAAAGRLRHKLAATGLCFRITPGNSDLRCEATAAAVREVLATATHLETPVCLLTLLDTSEGRLGPEQRLLWEAATQQAGRRPLVVVTHMPPASLDAASRDWLVARLAQQPGLLFIAAHTHRDQSLDLGAARARVLRGMDPDKAIGGPPAIGVFELGGSGWHEREIVFPGGTPETWGPDERAVFRDLLGMSCSDDSVGGLALAAEAGLACVELRAGSVTEETELAKPLAQWRSAGGRYLSWHMPNLRWDQDAQTVTGQRKWQRALGLIACHGADALTVHVPRVAVGLLQPGSTAWCRLADAVCDLVAPLAAAGTTIGVENLHMTAREASDEQRGFGYLPAECLAWVGELRARLGAATVGLLLDIGHARNNGPYATEYTLGVWYALTGHEIVGYHLHQVVPTAEGMRNHQPIRELYGPLVSYSSFLWAWHSGQLNHAPMYLEIPDEDGRRESLAMLRLRV